MRVLLTGGAGFIGSHLAERLVRDGHRVHVLDDLSTGSRENLARALDSGRCELSTGSATDASLVTELAMEADAVVHLAATVGVRLVLERPAEALETNIESTRAVLRAARHGRKRVLLASSSEVYGKRTKMPFVESDVWLRGMSQRSRWSYAYSKALSEVLALADWHEYGVPVVVGRFFNTVGPRQSGRYGMVLPTFAQQALAGEPITVHGDGEQRRCFAHVRDTVEALTALLECEDATGEVFNIGSQNEVSMLTLARMVREAADSDSEITLVPYKRAFGPGFEDMPRRVPDTSKLERTIGFAPSTSLEEIVADVVADQRAHAPQVRSDASEPR